ncbi:MAG: thiamine phosphate synthase [Bryobacterales bacterium]|nr:thiamine phosphate synthase [Bryobacterales bacterium]
MIRYYITDSRALGGADALCDLVASAAQAGIERIQIREKDLDAKALCALVTRILDSVRGTAARILVNDRLDVALACGAHGVHLPSRSVPPSELRRICPPDFLIGVSCHSPEDVAAAESEGADFTVLGPIFYTESKQGMGAPLGIDTLRRAAKSASIPVLALGGITAMTIPLCLEAGAAGIAGISLFQQERNWIES